MLTVTNTSLLIGLRDRNNEVVWKQFFNRYQPLLMAFAQKLGLAEQDATDAAQEALLAFVGAYREGAYERDKGRLRTWLFGIAARKVRDLQRRKRAPVAVGGDASETAFPGQIPDDEQLGQVWDAQWQQALLKQCLDEVRRQVKPRTMQVFELLALQDWPAEKVAAELAMTENAVWIAKNRVISRMREIHRDFEENW